MRSVRGRYPTPRSTAFFIVFQSVFSKVAVSGNAQMNTISHSAKQTPGSTSQNSCSGKSARRMYTSAPRRASAASRMSQSSVDFLKLSRNARKKAALFQCPDSRIMFRTAVQSAAVEAPSVKTGSEHTTHRMFSHASSAACVRKRRMGESGSKSFFILPPPGE